MPNQAQITQPRALDANANPVAGAQAFIYASGTATLLTIYSDSAATIPRANPVVADGNGAFPQFFVNEPAKAVVQTAAGATLYTIDPVPLAVQDGAAASVVSFTPSAELPFTNVQAAIAGLDSKVRGAGVASNTSSAVTNADTHSLGGIFFMASGATFNSAALTEPSILQHFPADSTARAMQIIDGLTTGERRRRIETAGAWGAPEVLPRIGTTAGTVPALNAGGFLPAGIAINWSAPQTVTTATAIDFTGIPSTATMIFLVARGGTLSATDNFLVQLGTAGGFVSTGYASTSLVMIAGSNAGTTSTAGFVIISGAAARTFSGSMTLFRLSGTTTWIANHTGGGGAAFSMQGGGDIALGAAATQIRLTRASTATIAGTFMVGWL